MPFHVVNMATGEPITANGVAIIWINGSDAAAYAAAYSCQHNVKAKPKRIPEVPGAWKAREQARFNDGVYERLPWWQSSWWSGSIGEQEHLAHVSREKDGFIAFTESDEKGHADNQTRIKPGTYLERYYSDRLTKADIKRLAGDYAGKYEKLELLFATTREEIRRVYERGPSSCMSASSDKYSCHPIHPVEIYAAGDLAVAYIRRGKHIAARALCWPSKKEYGRIYGDVARIKPLFDKGGWKYSHLKGAKLLRIPVPGSKHNIACPYIDGSSRVTICDDHLLIDGPTVAGPTNGILRVPFGIVCSHCNHDGFTAEQMTIPIDAPDRRYCKRCRQSYLRLDSTPGHTPGSYYIRTENLVFVRANGPEWSGVFWIREYAITHAFTCAWTGELYPNEMKVEVWRNARIEHWERDVFENMGFACSHCKNNVLNDDHTIKQCKAKLCLVCDAIPDRKKIGRDESPDQNELALEWDGKFQIGDEVRLLSNKRGTEIHRWYTARGGSPKKFIVNRIYGADLIKSAAPATLSLNDGSLWDACAFTLVNRSPKK